MSNDPNMPPSAPTPPPPYGSGAPQQPDPTLAQANSKKIAAGLCGILIGALGIHKFLLGYKTAGLIMLLVTVLTCGIAGSIMGIIGLIEGIIYITKSDVDFYQIYMANKKEWF